MANLTRTEIVEQIDFERRESNAKFISASQTIKLLDRALKRLLREPGIRTVESLQTITPSGLTSAYTLNDDFKEVISIYSGEGSNNGIQFHYMPSDEYHLYPTGFLYTFIAKGYIDIKFPDVNSLPSSTIRLRYWTKNVILGGDGVTEQRTWGDPDTAEDDERTSRLPEEYDDFFIAWVVAKILKREGKKDWKDWMDDADKILEMLKEQPGSKTRRTRKAFGWGA
jgi:hypothetical protein